MTGALHEYESLTYEEIAARAPSAVAVVPLGCTEQQGPHLPVGFDTWFAAALCCAAAVGARDRSDTDALVLPVLPYGPTPEHRGFGSGYVDLPQPLHEAVVEAALVSLAEQGFRRIIVWRGCGGHRVEDVVSRFAADHPRVRVVVPAWPFHDIWCRIADPRVPAGHADSFTTSIALHLWPEHVRVDRIPGPSGEPDWDDPKLDLAAVSSTGVIGDPRHGSPELGRRLWEEAVSSLAEAIARIDEPRTANRSSVAMNDLDDHGGSMGADR